MSDLDWLKLVQQADRLAMRLFRRFLDQRNQTTWQHADRLRQLYKRADRRYLRRAKHFDMGVTNDHII